MNECIVYHWWQHSSDKPPIRNLRTPLAYSIATLRAVNPTIPIVVLEMGNDGPLVEWGNLPDRLGFRVERRQFSLIQHADKAGWKILSRFEDVYRWSLDSPHNTIIYADSDTFWLSDPLPLSQLPSKFSFNGSNNGFFYFDKNSAEVKNFLKIYDSFLHTALNDESFRVITRQYNRYINGFFVFDEAITRYMWMKLPGLCNTTPPYDHLTSDVLLNPSEIKRLKISRVRMLHAHGIRVQDPIKLHHTEIDNARGLTCLLIEPLLESIRSTVGLDYLYEKEHQGLTRYAVTLDGQFIDNLMGCRDDDGLYNLMRACGVTISR